MSEQDTAYFSLALDALKRGDRRGAAGLLKRQLRQGNTSAKNLPSVAQLAAHIGEIDLAVEAARAAVEPGSLPSLLGYWAMLGTYGRAEEALADIRRQPVSVREHPAVLHVRGTVEVQFGRFADAQELFRKALAKSPGALQTWFTLAMIKTFEPGDPDLTVMERLQQQAAGAPAEARSALDYGIGKAWEDVGDIDRAFASYSRGAALRRSQAPFDVKRYSGFADTAIRDFTTENLETLVPSGIESQRSLFVTGLPRSGTTLTEQILLGHSQVVDGAELNLFPVALMPTLGGTFAGALSYQQHSKAADPWGEIARDYAHLVDLQLKSPGRVVDKSLGQSLLIGLLLHALPEARIAWLRRSPEDIALSCFRTYFSTGLAWTWSLTDIADYMRAEDRLFEHWRDLFSDRILIVPYEELVASPDTWAERLQAHFGLDAEPGIANAPRSDRPVRTASVGQVRDSISTDRIGRAAAFEQYLKPFRDRYYA